MCFADKTMPTHFSYQQQVLLQMSWKAVNHLFMGPLIP